MFSLTNSFQSAPAPVGRATLGGYVVGKVRGVSIRARPGGASDRGRAFCQRPKRGFNPRPPRWGERPYIDSEAAAKAGFQSAPAPVGRATHPPLPLLAQPASTFFPRTLPFGSPLSPSLSLSLSKNPRATWPDRFPRTSRDLPHRFTFAQNTNASHDERPLHVIRGLRSHVFHSTLPVISQVIEA